MTGNILIMYNPKDVQTFHNNVPPGPRQDRNFAWSKTTIMKHEYQISGMTCGNCIATVEKQLSAVPGITSAKAKLDPPGITLTMEQHVPIEKLQHALKDHPKYKISEIHQAPVVLDEEDDAAEDARGGEVVAARLAVPGRLPARRRRDGLVEGDNRGGSAVASNQRPASEQEEDREDASGQTRHRRGTQQPFARFG